MLGVHKKTGCCQDTSACCGFRLEPDQYMGLADLLAVISEISKIHVKQKKKEVVVKMV